MADTPPNPAPVPFPAIAIAWGDNENEGVNLKLLGPFEQFEMSDLFEGWFTVRLVNDQEALLAFLTTQQQEYAESVGEDEPTGVATGVGPAMVHDLTGEG